MKRRFWQISGYDGLAKIYERRLPWGSLSEAEVTEMLRRLQCRHLSDDEIIDSSLRKNAPGKAHHLNIDQNKKDQTAVWALSTVNSSWFYTAKIVSSDEVS